LGRHGLRNCLVQGTLKDMWERIGRHYFAEIYRVENYLSINRTIMTRIMTWFNKLSKIIADMPFNIIPKGHNFSWQVTTIPFRCTYTQLVISICGWYGKLSHMSYLSLKENSSQLNNSYNLILCNSIYKLLELYCSWPDIKT
jgi:hypothetical protein